MVIIGPLAWKILHQSREIERLLQKELDKNGVEGEAGEAKRSPTSKK